LQLLPPLQVLPASLQSAHATPLLPHAVSVFPGKHVGPLRHPAQKHCFVTVPTQVSPFVVQSAQALPPLPHALFWLPGLQVLPLQHPRPHEVVVQVHKPLLHTCPVPQTGPEGCH
jgi:hypothetical protein